MCAPSHGNHPPLPAESRHGLARLSEESRRFSERILTKLRADGYAMSPDYAGADIVLVNTCGFLDSAKEESLEAIGEAIAENGRVIVTGCMGKEAETIRARFPNVLAVTGAHEYEQVVGAVHEAAPMPPSRLPQPRARARPQADPAPLLLSQDFRGLQPPLRLLHHSQHCAAISSAGAPMRSCARPSGWSPPARASCW